MDRASRWLPSIPRVYDGVALEPQKYVTFRAFILELNRTGLELEAQYW
jgi:hypothetical protein